MPPKATSRQSLFRGAHHFHMRDLINAPCATQVNAINEAGGEHGRLDMRDFFNAPNATQINVVNNGGPLDSLPKHPEMSTKRAEYLPDSRKPEVEELCQRESNGTDLVLCIHGPAGIGKSTLAGHLSDRFRSAGRLAASIFLGAFPTDTSGPEVIVKMTAREIGSIHPRAIQKIVEAMDQCHGTSLEIHLQKYILEPLRSLKHRTPLIIIIDAMDEWRDHPLFIKALASLNSHSHVVKFILTDRLNPCASHFPGIEKINIYTYALGPISEEVIKAYFHKHLETVPWVDGRIPSPADVEKLTELSGGLPVWAATVIVLLSHPFSESPPHEILGEIVGSRRRVGGSDELGALYCNGLRRLFPSSGAQRQFRRYFGASIVLQESLSPSDFSKLVGIPPHLIDRVQFALSAFQIRSPPPGSEKRIYPATTLFHQSLIEYVQATTTQSSFLIPTFDSHSTLGLACLSQIASLPSSPHAYHLLDHQRYAVKYWPFHVSKGTPRPNNQWSQTEHCLALQKIKAETQRQWAALFVESLLPGDTYSATNNLGRRGGMVSILSVVVDSLDRSEDCCCWGFQVACLEIAVRIDANRNATVWSRLGECYRARGDRTGSLQMYEEAVVVLQHALDLRTGLHPDRAKSLDAVATALTGCYHRNRNFDILSKAASLYREALGLCPVPHPDRPRLLNNLAGALQSISDYDGGAETLTESISLHRDALALHPAPHPYRSSSLSNLANALQSLYRLNGGIGTLSEAISLNRKALALRPAPHPDRFFSLSNLASALQSLYNRNGDIGTLKEAVSLHREALTLRPTPHPDRPLSLSNLAGALRTHYNRDGGIGTLKEAISLLREALTLRPAPHPARPLFIRNLAGALQTLYKHDGSVGTLNEIISLLREALGLRPAPHPDRSDLLNNLAKALRLLYKRNGTIETLAKATSLDREALALRPVPHSDHPQSLQDRAKAPLSQFERKGGVEVLDEAISLHREQLVFRRPGYRSRERAVNDLLQLLVNRQNETGDDRDHGEIRDLKAELVDFRQEKAREKLLLFQSTCTRDDDRILLWLATNKPTS